MRRVQRGADGQGASFYTQQPLTICLPKSETACRCVLARVCEDAYANLSLIIHMHADRQSKYERT